MGVFKNIFNDSAFVPDLTNSPKLDIVIKAF